MADGGEKQERLPYELVLRQLTICSTALSQIEHDPISPLERRPWVVARDALEEARGVFPADG